ncbi:MAG: 3-oxoacyl-[acyl-carrier protein] reductase [bacterium]|jgi:NAD(P)-dependent dehydrogenase (short-subunit alcohol dehydrogenase family)
MHAVFGELFSGKTVVITGAGNGIGKATAHAFNDAGAKVIAHLGRNASYADELPKKVTGWTGDFTQPVQQQAFIDFVKSTTSQVDVLINNAGTMLGRFPADTLTDAQYDAIVELNQHSVVRITRGLLPLLRESTTAAIVNTVSISASTGGSPGSSIYSATKAFVSTYSRGLARELAPDGIRVNAVSPGVIDTNFHSRYSSTEKLEATRRQIPLQRLGTPEDCAPTFLFLSATELSGYITGQVIEINGGQR